MTLETIAISLGGVKQFVKKTNGVDLDKQALCKVIKDNFHKGDKILIVRFNYENREELSCLYSSIEEMYRPTLAYFDIFKTAQFDNYTTHMYVDSSHEKFYLYCYVLHNGKLININEIFLKEYNEGV